MDKIVLFFREQLVHFGLITREENVHLQQRKIVRIWPQGSNLVTPQRYDHKDIWGVMSDHLEASYAGVDAGVEGEMGHFFILNRPPNVEALFGRWLRSTRHVTCVYTV